MISKKCDLCYQKPTFLSLFLYNCVEEEILICYECAGKIRQDNYSFQQPQNVGYIYFTLYEQQIDVYYDSPCCFYKLKQHLCEICLGFQICSKICKNDHYICLQCIKKHIKASLRKQHIQCPIINCDQKLDDFTIARTISKFDFPEWNRMIYNLFCPNRLCSKIIRFRPFDKVQTQINYVNEFISECMICKAQICNICWMQYAGSHTKHQKICKTNQYRDKLLQQYIKQYSVNKCPKCEFYSEKACRLPSTLYSKIQQCQLCNTKFCLKCKTGIAQLFRSLYLVQSCYNCELIADQVLNKKRKLHKIKEVLSILILICLTPALILVIAFRLIITIGRPIIQYTKYLLGITKILQNRFLLILIFPFVILIVTIVITVAYLFLFIPLLLKNLIGKLKSLKCEQ